MIDTSAAVNGPQSTPPQLDTPVPSNNEGNGFVVTSISSKQDRGIKAAALPDETRQRTFRMPADLTNPEIYE